MCSIWGSFLSLVSILDFQHCADEAQKAETVLSAVIYYTIFILNTYKFQNKGTGNLNATLHHLAEHKWSHQKHKGRDDLWTISRKKIKKFELCIKLTKFLYSAVCEFTGWMELHWPFKVYFIEQVYSRRVFYCALEELK